MKTKVKNCPFCGSKPIVYDETHLSFTLYHYWIVKCQKCNFLFKEYFTNLELPNSTKIKNKLIKRWNTRKNTCCSVE